MKIDYGMKLRRDYIIERVLNMLCGEKNMKMLEKYNIIPENERGRFHNFDITPAAKWFLSENEQESYDINQDFDHLSPPYPEMWMEFEHPTSIFSKEKGTRYIYPHQNGLLAKTLELDKGFAADFLAKSKNDSSVMARMIANVTGAKNFQPLNGDRQELDKLLSMLMDGETIRWFTLWYLFTDDRTLTSHFKKPFVPVVMRAGFLNETGKSLPGFVLAALQPELSDPSDIMAAAALFLPFAFALQLLHCKNVTTPDIVTPPKVLSRRAKRGAPSVKYKTLVVNSLKKESSTVANGKSGSIKNALHFVRGHFKDFSHGGGLFGRYKGMYWWSPRLRGDASSGVVKKDYRVSDAHSLKTNEER